LIGLFLLAVSCAPAQAQPASSQPLLFAALKAEGAANILQWNTVVLAGLDGNAKAKTTFTPMPMPFVGCGVAPVLPASAVVVAAKVYFADGNGVVRSLSPSGQVTQVATFALTSSQQMLSFAIRPDGTHLLATVFTIPPRSAFGDCHNPGAPMVAGSEFGLDVFSARAGGASQLLYHETMVPTATSQVPDVMAFTGWGNLGPFGTYPTGWGTEGGVIERYHGTPVRIDANTGKVLGQIADPKSCAVSDIVPSGDFVCTQLGGGDVSVRRPDGSEIWRFPSQSSSVYTFGFLAPDEHRVVATNGVSEVLGRDGTRVKLPDRFFHDGWLDSSTVVGGGVDVNLTYVTLHGPSTVVDLGFKGLFVGTVQPS
jgi:hypothetical protein